MKVRQKPPLISVITVVFNAEEFIEASVQSVINQTYENIEFIIVDGESSDSTLSILGRYKKYIRKLVSEPDDGIYNAMNKGINMASGDWIVFMNAGDQFSSCDVISSIFNFCRGPEKIIYGDVIVNYGDFSFLKRAGDLARLWTGMKFSHQSAFIEVSYHKYNKYDESFRIAADFNFFLNAYKNQIQFKYVNIPISTVIIGGVSERNRLQTINDSRAVVHSVLHNKFYDYVYVFILIDTKFRNFIKAIFPKALIHLIIKLKSNFD